MPQRNLVLVTPRWSRNTQSSGVSSAAVTSIGVSLIDSSDSRLADDTRLGDPDPRPGAMRSKPR
jgi:hypothetical protein